MGKQHAERRTLLHHPPSSTTAVSPFPSLPHTSDLRICTKLRSELCECQYFVLILPIDIPITAKEVKFYTVTYDLRQPGRKYNELYDAIKSIAGDGNWQHPMESFWVMAFSEFSLENSNSIFEKLRMHIDANDSIIVCRMELADSQGWLPKSFWDWIAGQKDKK